MEKLIYNMLQMKREVNVIMLNAKTLGTLRERERERERATL